MAIQFVTKVQSINTVHAKCLERRKKKMITLTGLVTEETDEQVIFKRGVIECPLKKAQITITPIAGGVQIQMPRWLAIKHKFIY